MQPLSNLLNSVPASVTAMMMQKGRELKAAGHDVINLAGGEPDFNTPKQIIDAAHKAMLAGDTHYPTAHGSPALIDAIVAKLARENDVHVSANNIMVTPGGKWALYATLAALLNPGEEVLILDPSWVSYGPMVALQGAIPVRVNLSGDDNFRVTAAQLEAHISPRTKLIMVNSPNNPTGRVLTRAEIDDIVAVATKHDLYVLSDEIYEHIVYDDNVHHSLAAEPGMAARTIIVNGFSKGYAMTGWRLGWLAGPEPVVKLARTLQTQSITSAASFAMTAGAVALNGPQACVYQMTQAYAARRRFMLTALNEIPGIECAPIEGAFYLFPKFTATEKDSLALSQVLLDEALIATTPGVAFGQAGEGHVRFSIATAMDELEQTVERLAELTPRL